MHSRSPRGRTAGPEAARRRPSSGLAARLAGGALLLLTIAAAPAGPATRLAGELDVAGLEKRLAQEKGKVVLLNFWATWCEPCREEFPALSRLQKTYGGQGLRVLGVSTDFASQIPAVEKFLAAQRPTFPNYRKKSGGDDQDFINAVDRSWGGELPFTVLYARDGKKAKVLTGQQTEESFTRELRALLK